MHASTATTFGLTLLKITVYETSNEAERAADFSGVQVYDHFPTPVLNEMLEAKFEIEVFLTVASRYVFPKANTRAAG